MTLVTGDFQRRLDFSKDKASGQNNKRRIIIAVLFFGSTIASFLLWSKQNLGDLREIFFQRASYHVAKPEQTQLEKSLGFKPNLEDSEGLGKTINFITKDLMGTYGIYYYSLNSNKEFGINENEIFTAASVNKVPIIVSFYEQVEKGILKEDDTYSLLRNDIQDYGTGQMRYQKIGTTYLMSDLIELSGKLSDNTAAYVLEKYISRSYIQNRLNKLSLQKTSLKDNETTPKEIGSYFKMLYQGKLIKDENRDKIYKALTDTEYEDRISKLLPSNIRVVHKIGNEIQTSNDCGIVFSPNPYVLCILTKGTRESEALDFIPKLSLLIWEFAKKN
ncbi:hypothetical protein A3J78_02130 [Candidatus Beckwithbacteria bacterium RBG_13_35_6]|uniref:Beta-lactamase class A catalytic domain-containing protein n=1 Tax=Candidatus Beckwithbacteria bacterium RBG_13_35_6 TaxID=1797456 RepID=A0A1F5DCZ6_9BACT|nr:MAG: hypothetical protein A3J78_02130 [Candidatus Beckwithbacteria bacterium RBG_13_35_6]